mgnify:CR=1 FL=1
MYYSERYNPDEGVRLFYSSVPRSMWMTFLNLTGESPLNDHTAQGKAVALSLQEPERADARGVFVPSCVSVFLTVCAWALLRLYVDAQTLLCVCVCGCRDMCTFVYFFVRVPRLFTCGCVRDCLCV